MKITLQKSANCAAEITVMPLYMYRNLVGSIDV